AEIPSTVRAMAQCERGRDRQHRQERCSLSKLVGALLKGLGLVAQQKFDRHFQLFHNELMARKQPYDLSYDQATKEHLQAIDAKYHSLIRGEIEEQLVSSRRAKLATGSPCGSQRL